MSSAVPSGSIVPMTPTIQKSPKLKNAKFMLQIRFFQFRRNKIGMVLLSTSRTGSDTRRCRETSIERKTKKSPSITSSTASSSKSTEKVQSKYTPAGTKALQWDKYAMTTRKKKKIKKEATPTHPTSPHIARPPGTKVASHGGLAG